MKTTTAWMAAAVCAVTLTGCEWLGLDADEQRTEFTMPGIEALPAKPADVVAVVNGRPITGSMVELYSVSRSQQHPAGKQPQPRELTDELINLELLSEAAVRTGLDRRPDIATELYFQRANLLASAMIEEQARAANIAEAEIENLYRQRYPDGKITEYRTRQILVNDRGTAEQLIAKLRSGSSFAELAKNHSKGPAASRGGALDWFQPNQVLPEFAAAVAKLRTGEHTRSPVRTTYGWHVILLEDVRQVAAPSLDQAAADIVQELITERLERHLDELRANAEIELKRP